MSDFDVVIKRIAIKPHTNADSLELATVYGYNVVVGKGIHKDGNLVAYIPEQAVLPEWLIDYMELTGKLAGKDKNRVKAIKLRGELSEGLVLPLVDGKLPVNTTGSLQYVEVKEDDVVTELLQITKYAPEIPTHMSGEVWNAMGMTLSYDIQNIKKYNRIIDHGDIVFVTEKLHGTFTCYGYNNEQLIVTSKGLSSKGLALKDNEANANNMYLTLYKTNPNIQNMLSSLVERFNSPVYILGEIFGKGVQDLHYGLDTKQFRVFDIFVGNPNTGRYLDAMDVVKLCNEFDVLRVPVLYIGPYASYIIEEFTNGKETVSGDSSCIREGCIIKPYHERKHDSIGRVILKSVSDAYLTRKGDVTEYQ